MTAHPLVVTPDSDDPEQVTGSVECPRVTDACYVWWECTDCNLLDEARRTLPRTDARCRALRRRVGLMSPWSRLD
jgi:hypothetical protein